MLCRTVGQLRGTGRGVVTCGQLLERGVVTCGQLLERGSGGKLFVDSFSSGGQRSTHTNSLKSHYDAVVIGAGHNGLVSAAYLQKAGLDVCVVERRHIIGGAAVTEEIIPGLLTAVVQSPLHQMLTVCCSALCFKFSRASYVLSLLRPQIVKDLQLKKYGLKVYLRDPSSYTPLATPGGRDGTARSLLLSRDHEKNKQQIAQFSHRDAQAFSDYEERMDRIVAAMDPLLDNPPFPLTAFSSASLWDKWNSLPSIIALLGAVKSLGPELTDFYEFMTAPAQKILDRWFESEPLKATLATDSVIGAMLTPDSPGSGYVLLHHVMGELEGIKGAWGYVEGGMGGVSQAIANCATDHGASIFCDRSVSHVLTRGERCEGVVLVDGTEIRSRVVLSNATPSVTFLDLVKSTTLPDHLTAQLKHLDFKSPVTKINVAVDRLPDFLADPNIHDNTVMPHHRCTIHINCEDSRLITDAYLQCQAGQMPTCPVIEMVIPSSLDPTLAPPGSHVVLLFTQYTPYTLAGDRPWDDTTRNQYADIVFDSIEKYAPGFKKSVIGQDILTPPDLEEIFGLTGGNIFHGAMSLDQLFLSRPIPALCNYRCPIRGLYLCGSGAHPGGGVMGSPGRLAAQTVLADYTKL
ncbi:pyridine nucleotide-disulfide oxidoreductase domain-containing protein 2-like isoform X1 [Haliotis rufescens]|uniref:pyridine nucleotide-disulfide oxidoreductase domain-containing protein 2-like isoform X1 n=1 Tax=Haliotis rufescens TaxID=6454 RepID=UPI00201F397B|nr:pyridine nucleotide-disulfide oxidoreductase domain-containing protein 2-like isoform X1 [Haliotis rufescens]